MKKNQFYIFFLICFITYLSPPLSYAQPLINSGEILKHEQKVEHWKALPQTIPTFIEIDPELKTNIKLSNILIHEFSFEGNKIVSSPKLQEVLANHKEKKASQEILKSIAKEITYYYQQQGRLITKVSISPDKNKEGLFLIQIKE
jgi:hemolysin activation/secretion protein